MQDVQGIARVCAAGWRTTYRGSMEAARIEAVIAEFYEEARIRTEIAPAPGWDGWVVAVDHGEVVGAGGGGMTAPAVAELFVLYVDEVQRGRGIGSALLEHISACHREQGATEQWVSVEPDNRSALAFYEARGFRPRGERPAYGAAMQGRMSARLVRGLR
jgi:ribosomal protein S18 acetylase RimI-like enzyme